MRPLTVVTGIVLGSCASVAISLAAVMLIFLILGDQYPRVAHEFQSLAASLGLFFAMTIISALSFLSLVRRHPARWLAQCLMWAGLLFTGYYFWP